MKKIYLIRHGKTESSCQGRFTGRTDVCLSRQGKQQAQFLSNFLGKINPDVCFSSPMKRVRETAETAMCNTDINILYDENLCEIDFGSWEMKTFNEISDIYPDETEAWNKFENTFTFPEGESIGAFLLRVKKFAKRIEDKPADTLAVFTHGGVIRSLICLWLGLDKKNYILFNIRPASITRIDLFENKGILTGIYNSGSGAE